MRRRVRALLELGASAAEQGELSRGVMALRLALDEGPDHAAAQKLVYRARDMISATFQRFLGDLTSSPRLAMALADLGPVQLDSRAASCARR